jgi:uncharacterized membrane protein YfhO
LERILSPSFDFRTEVVLEESPPEWVEPPAEDIPAASAHMVDYQPSHVTVDVKTAVDGLLVLTDTYAPGWKAALDGRPVSLYVADHTFRAVVVPAGNHRVTFAYRPCGFYVGAALSLLGLITTTAVFFIPRLKGPNLLH